MDAVVGNQQVEASFTLLGVVIYAEVVHKIVNGGVVKHRVAAVQQLFQLLPEHFLQPVRNGAPGLDALGRHQLRHGRSIGGGVFLQEIRLPHQLIQGIAQLLLKGLVVLQTLPVLRHRVPIRGHVGGKAGQALEQVEHPVVEQRRLQKRSQIRIFLLT